MICAKAIRRTRPRGSGFSPIVTALVGGGDLRAEE